MWEASFGFSKKQFFRQNLLNPHMLISTTQVMDVDPCFQKERGNKRVFYSLSEFQFVLVRCEVVLVEDI